MNNLRMLYVQEENLAPERFQFIFHPQLAINRIQYLPSAEIKSLFHRQDILCFRLGASPYQQGSDLKKSLIRDVQFGTLVAVDESCSAWSPAIHYFLINSAGKLCTKAFDNDLFFASSQIIRRYEEMVMYYDQRPNATVLPPMQVTRTGANPTANAADVTKGYTAASETPIKELTKRERWQERKYLIGRGESSIFPDARIAANRLAQNNIAVEKAKLTQNIYRTTNPLIRTPDVPEGWHDVSNSDSYLHRLGLKSTMLYDNSTSPNFLARVYAPDSSVFGSDMNPTVVFRGSRAPGFPGMKQTASSLWNKFEIPPIKNSADWLNNFYQGLGKESDYYRRAVEIGKRLSITSSRADIAGHSLGGGMASAAAVASGKSGWTFNAAGLNSSTVEKYGGQLLGHSRNLHAYRVDGEVLTKMQEINPWQDLKDVAGVPIGFIAKEALSAKLPNAEGITHDLAGGVGNTLDRHGIQQVIDCIEKEKQEDINLIRGRI